MITCPAVSQHRRDQLASASMIISIPRALAWVVGAIVGSIVAGFAQGWRDAA